MHDTTHIVDQAAALRELAVNKTHSRSVASVHTWAVTSGKGGVGKSVFALNFAIALCEAGRTVLLVDADENLGKIDVMMGLSPQYRIPDVVSGTVTVDDALLNPLPGLFLLAGSSGSMNYPEITIQERTAFIRKISLSSRGITDVIFDTGAGIHHRVITYAAAADDVIIVSHPEPVTILDAYAVIKMIAAKNNDVSLNVVMNKSHSPTECDEAAAKLRKAVKHFLSTDVRYLGIVPFDEQVGKAIMQQVPLTKAYARSAAALCIRSIAKSLMQFSSTTRTQQEVVYA